MARITTVRGDINADDLGFTSMHEHTLLDLRPAGKFMKNLFPDVTQEMVDFKLENFPFLKTGTYLINDELAVVDDLDFLVKEYGFFKELGGKSVCDCSPSNIRGNILGIRSLSELTGLHLICATGFYTESSQPADTPDRCVGKSYRTNYLDDCRNDHRSSERHPSECVVQEHPAGDLPARSGGLGNLNTHHFTRHYHCGWRDGSDAGSEVNGCQQQPHCGPYRGNNPRRHGPDSHAGGYDYRFQG